MSSVRIETNPGILLMGKALRSCYDGAPRKKRGEGVLDVLFPFTEQTEFSSCGYVLAISSPPVSLMSKSTMNTSQRRVVKPKGERHVLDLLEDIPSAVSLANLKFWFNRNPLYCEIYLPII